MKEDNNITDIIFGIGILAMLIIMIGGAIIYSIQ